MRRNKLDVAYKKDIIKITAERLGLPEDKVEDVVNFSFEYLKFLTEQEDTATVELPGLGFLHLQFREYFKTYSRQVSSKKAFPNKQFPNLNKMKRKIDLLNEEGIMEGVNYHKKYPRLKNTRLNMKMSLEELENHQNNED